MWGFNKKKKSNPDGANLLASILVCYPEITTISYEPDNATVEITFTLNRPMGQQDFDEMAQFIGESLAAYHSLEGFNDTGIDFSMELHGDFGFLHIKRDLRTLSRGEIALLVAIMRERFGNELAVDDNTRMDSDYRAAQEEMIDRMFGTVRQLKLADRLVGIREEDHVVVFDR